MHIEWAVLKKDDGLAPTGARIHVTLNRHGTISLGKYTYRRMGEPAALLIMFDRVNSRIALKPTALSMKNAYRVGKSGVRFGRRIRAFRMLIDFGIKIDKTLEFKDAEIDMDGQLILDLRTARVSPRARK